MVEKTEAGGCGEHCPLTRALRLAHELKAGVRRCLPEEFWQHRAAARREGLLALRSLIDAALECGAPAPARKATRIKVEG